jgi:predicted CoA-binding protein
MAGEFCEIPEKNATDDEAREILRSYHTIAVVGMSRNPEKPSHRVPQYLQEKGYRIIPVNPTVEGSLLGEPVFRTLRDIPGPVELVDIFRPSKDVPPIIDDAIAIGAKGVWMQEGIVHNEAAVKARGAGLRVIMDKCMMKVHRSG